MTFNVFNIILIVSRYISKKSIYVIRINTYWSGMTITSSGFNMIDMMDERVKKG